MGVSYNPRTVTDGLVLCLDAANRKSYPGSGTTWTDLSGRGNTGTLTNMDGTNLNSANGGSLTFDGINEFISVPSGIPQRTNEFTNEIWVYPTNLTGGANGYSTLIRMNGFRVGGGSGDFYFVLRNLGQVHCEIKNTADNGYDSYTTSTGIIQVNNWYHIVQVINRTSGNLKFYVNRVSVLDVATTTYGIVTGSAIQIAQQETDVNGQYARRLTGRVANVKLYNRALSAAEIQQNFNALRGRFGI
jgi:hypothetical protein